MMLTTLMILASVTFIAMMSPGPDMMLIVKYSSAKNRGPAVSCIAGICCGVAVHVAFSILGIAAVIAASSTAYSTMKYAGAAYLMYVGIRSLLAGGGLTFNREFQPGSGTAPTPFFDGLLCNVLNPKVTFFILAVFTQVIEPSTAVTQKVIYGAFIALEAFVVWNVFVVLVRTRLVLEFIQRFQVTIDRLVGVVLIGFGGALALDDVKK